MHVTVENLNVTMGIVLINVDSVMDIMIVVIGVMRSTAWVSRLRIEEDH